MQHTGGERRHTLAGYERCEQDRVQRRAERGRPNPVRPGRVCPAERPVLPQIYRQFAITVHIPGQIIRQRPQNGRSQRQCEHEDDDELLHEKGRRTRHPPHLPENATYCTMECLSRSYSRQWYVCSLGLCPDSVGTESPPTCAAQPR